jgi:hypothetical protein
MVVFPYRQKDGYCSILEAVDRADARQWLKDCSGDGVRFCEVNIDHCELKEMYGPDIDKHVEGFLERHRNFVT